MNTETTPTEHLFPNAINTSGSKIAINRVAAEQLEDIQGFSADWMRLLNVHFTAETIATPKGDGKWVYEYGRYDSKSLVANPTTRPRHIKVHVGSVRKATNERVDLPFYRTDSQANLGRNTSAVLIHELLHARDEILLLEALWRSSRLIRSVGLLSLKKEIEVKQARRLTEDIVIREVSSLFEQNPDFGTLVRFVS